MDNDLNDLNDCIDFYPDSYRVTSIFYAFCTKKSDASINKICNAKVNCMPVISVKF